MGERVFDVFLQGKQVLDEFDIARESGGEASAVIKEFNNVLIGKDLIVSFDARHGKSLLSGIELRREQ